MGDLSLLFVPLRFLNLPPALDTKQIERIKKRSKKREILIITIHPPQIFEPSTSSEHKTNSPQAQTDNGDVDANKGILVDLLNLLVQAPKSATLKSLIFINQIEDGLNDSKGQLNSELIYEVIVSPKMPTKNYQDFCPTL